jgi:hypothetical protein
VKERRIRGWRPAGNVRKTEPHRQERHLAPDHGDSGTWYPIPAKNRLDPGLERV